VNLTKTIPATALPLRALAAKPSPDRLMGWTTYRQTSARVRYQGRSHLEAVKR
jgi:hypothetical protein